MGCEQLKPPLRAEGFAFKHSEISDINSTGLTGRGEEYPKSNGMDVWSPKYEADFG